MARLSGLPRLLREIRDRLDLSQEKLAAALRVSLPTINRWEKGKTKPDGLALHALQQFVRQLGPEYGDLYEGFFGEEGRATLPLGASMLPRTTPARRRRGRGRREERTDRQDNGRLHARALENLLWKAACSIRGERDAPKFKDYILPLVFVKRLSDVFDDEMTRLTELYGAEKTAREIVEVDPSLVRFYLPQEATWAVISGRKKFDGSGRKRPKTIGERLTHAVRIISRANPLLRGVIDIVDYNEIRNGEREIGDEALSRLVELLSNPRYRMGLTDVKPDFLGRAYECLLRKFAEGRSASDFFTPKEVGWLIARLMEPRQGEEVYDPCCGSGGLLIKCQLALKEREQEIARPLKLYGQELTGSSFAIARMNMVIHDMEGEIVRGNSMTNPKFRDVEAHGAAPLRQFDIVVAHPVWSQDNFDPASYENDPFGRFSERGGFAPASSADWAWLQHVHACLRDSGRGAVVMDTGAASRGSGGQGENKEKTIRRWFVDNDLVEGVILLPENLFYNTTAAGVIVVLNNNKPKERRGRVVLIHASDEFQKGRPKNLIPDESIKKIADAFHGGKDIERLVKAVCVEEIVKNDYNLSPSRYIETAAATRHRDVQVILDELTTLEGGAVPSGRDEQRAIAAVVSKIQAAVEMQEKIVATLKELKAATMAGLFREGLRGEPLKQIEIGEIPLPSKTEQEEIARAANSLNARIREAESRLVGLQSLFSSMRHLLMTGQVRVEVQPPNQGHAY